MEEGVKGFRARSGMWEEGWAPRPAGLEAPICSSHLRRGWVPPSPQDLPPLPTPFLLRGAHSSVSCLPGSGPLLPPQAWGLPCSFKPASLTLCLFQAGLEL